MDGSPCRVDWLKGASTALRDIVSSVWFGERSADDVKRMIHAGEWLGVPHASVAVLKSAQHDILLTYSFSGELCHYANRFNMPRYSSRYLWRVQALPVSSSTAGSGVSADELGGFLLRGISTALIELANASPDQNRSVGSLSEAAQRTGANIDKLQRLDDRMGGTPKVPDISGELLQV